jgi:maleylpyruvate isomerase
MVTFLPDDRSPDANDKFSVMTVDVRADISAVASAHAALLHTVGNLTDDDARQPSLLPDWTRGHVLTHVARNADAMVRLCTWATTGVVTPAYPSREERNSDIEAGAGRPAAELRDDLRASHDRFMTGAETLAAADSLTPVRFGADKNDTPGEQIPQLRLGEVEVHHVDLGLDYTPAHWSEEFVDRLLTRVCADFERRYAPGVCLISTDDHTTWTIGDGGHLVTGPAPALLAWLIGRTDGTGLHAAGGTLPTLGPWR